MNLHDVNIEDDVLAGILAHPDFFLSEIDFILKDSDFYVTKNFFARKTIYQRMKSLLNGGNILNTPLLNHHLKDLNLTFKEDMTLSTYLDGLDIRSRDITEEAFKESAKVVVLLSTRRHFEKLGKEITDSAIKLDSSTSYDDLITNFDNIFHSKVDLLEGANNSGQAVKLFDIMPDLVYERVNDRSIYEEIGPLGPHKSINTLCGSLVKDGQITVLCASSGVGKTQFTTHYCMNIAGKHGIPVLHLDNGEMTEEETVFRMLASYSGVPLYLIESGKWADNSESSTRIENALSKLNSGEIRYEYYNVGGKNIDEIIGYIKRYYFREIGRGNKLIIHYDYIKSSYELNSNYKSEFQVVGEIVDKLKTLVNNVLTHEGKPKTCVITSVQQNQKGVVGERNSENVVDDESTISLSQRIRQFCSHMLILRKKTVDELQQDPVFCGRHIMKVNKARNAGSDFNRLENDVNVPWLGRHKKNYINLEFDNFKIVDRGDLVDLVSQAEGIEELQSEGDPTLDLPI